MYAVNWLHPCLLSTQRVPFTPPKKTAGDLTSLSTVAVRAGWWVAMSVALQPGLRFAVMGDCENTLQPERESAIVVLTFIGVALLSKAD